MSDPERGWRWWTYVAGRCLANLPRAVLNPLPVLDALINLEREAVWPTAMRGAGPTSLTLPERLFLRWLCAARPMAMAFEFGTGGGWTARLLADCGLKVHSLDLHFPGETSDHPSVCCHPRISLFAGDSRTFDFSPYEGQMDLVFVDGGHNRETVASDTAAAYRLRSPYGVIVWHDCNVQHRDVWRFLLELRQSKPLIRVDGTRFAVDFGSLYTGPP